MHADTQLESLQTPGAVALNSVPTVYIRPSKGWVSLRLSELWEYRELLYEMPIQIPDDILYLGRCVAILSGMCTSLDPEFNIWEGLAPFAQLLIKEEAGEIWEQVIKEVTTFGTLLFNLPRRLDTTLPGRNRGRDIALPVEDNAPPAKSLDMVGIELQDPIQKVERFITLSHCNPCYALHVQAIDVPRIPVEQCLRLLKSRNELVVRQ